MDLARFQLATEQYARRYGLTGGDSAEERLDRVMASMVELSLEEAEELASTLELDIQDHQTELYGLDGYYLVGADQFRLTLDLHECGGCGQRLTSEFFFDGEGKNPRCFRSGVSQVEGGFIMSKDRCNLPASQTVIWTTVDFPTGRVLATDYIGEPLDYDPGYTQAESINSAAGRINWTRRFAEIGVASANVGNSSPTIWLEEATGNLIIGGWGYWDDLPNYEQPEEDGPRGSLEHLRSDGSFATAEEVAAGSYAWNFDPYDEEISPPGWKKLGFVSTDLWAFMLTDWQTYLDAGGTEEKLGQNWHERQFIELKPGRYHFVTYGNHPEFGERGEPEIYAEALFEPLPTEPATDEDTTTKAKD